MATKQDKAHIQMNRESGASKECVPDFSQLNL